MAENMLKKMLSSLCRNGAEFCSPEQTLIGLERNPEPSPDGIHGVFYDNVPGDQGFHPEPGDHPYYPPERHPGHMEVMMPISGNVDFFINGIWREVPENRVYILSRNTLHAERNFQGKPYTLLWLTSLPSSLTLLRTEYAPEVGYRQSACRVVIVPPMADSLWKCGAVKPFNEIHFFSLLVQCLEYAVTHHLAEERSSDYLDAVLSQIREYLDENFNRPVTLEELSRIAHLSPIYLNRIYSRKYGVTVHRYLASLRLAEAKRLLNAGRNIGDIARSVGFPDQRYFSRFFRQHTGFSPSEYQNSRHS